MFVHDLAFEQKNKFACAQFRSGAADIWRLQQQKFGVPGGRVCARTPDGVAIFVAKQRHTLLKVRRGSGKIFTYNLTGRLRFSTLFEKHNKSNKTLFCKVQSFETRIQLHYRNVGEVSAVLCVLIFDPEGSKGSRVKHYYSN